MKAQFLSLVQNGMRHFKPLPTTDEDLYAGDGCLKALGQASVAVGLGLRASTRRTIVFLRRCSSPGRGWYTCPPIFFCRD